MAVPIGISVGDFIATVQLLKDISKALNEHGGAQSHYQHTVRNLETIQAILSRLESFHSASGQTTQINAIRAQAQAIQNEVQLFVQKIQKFKKTLGRGAPTSKRCGVLDKLKWSRKQVKEVEELSRSVDVQLRNIQVLLDLDISERSDLALQHHQHAASDISSLPTRQELLSSTSQAVYETRASERNIGSRVDRAEAALLLRLDSLEQSTRKTSDDMARTPRPDGVKPGPARLVLTLSIPQLSLSKQDVARLFGQLSDELEAILQCFSIWVGSMLALFVLLVPQMIMLQRTLRRLPAAISLALHDNMMFEDALGRLHSLQYEQFRHWRVFESSLQCIFADTPGIQKILKGHFVLTPENKPALLLTAANYSALVRPGYAFKMSMAMKKLTARASRCPKGCSGSVEKVSVLEYRCKVCRLLYYTNLLDSSLPENTGAESYETRSQTPNPEADLSGFGVGRRSYPTKSSAKVKKSEPDETSPLDAKNSALIRWRPQAYDPGVLIDRWESAQELAEIKAFKRVHLKMSLSENMYSAGYLNTFFEVRRELGRGGRGLVLLVEHVLDGLALGHFACKRVPVGDDKAYMEKVLTQVRSVTALSHQNIVSYHHVWLEEVQISRFGPPVPCAFILQQYCNGGDLQEYIYPERTPAHAFHERSRQRVRRQSETSGSEYERSKKSTLDAICSFFRDIAAGVQYLHHQGLIHCDLKPSNCLLHFVDQKRPRVLVSDFAEMQYDVRNKKSTGAAGTLTYSAPEVLLQVIRGGPSMTFNAKSDIFSLGMILFFMCFGNVPYKSANVLNPEFEDPDQLTEEILYWTGPGHEGRMRPKLSDDMDVLLDRLLSNNPDDRPTADEAHRMIDRVGLHCDVVDKLEVHLRGFEMLADRQNNTGLPFFRSKGIRID